MKIGQYFDRFSEQMRLCLSSVAGTRHVDGVVNTSREISLIQIT